MARIRWEPARELNSLQTEMNRLFNTFFDAPAPANAASVAQRRWVPAMDLIERLRTSSCTPTSLGSPRATSRSSSTTPS